jgi:hypothetical protein
VVKYIFYRGFARAWFLVLEIELVSFVSGSDEDVGMLAMVSVVYVLCLL